MNMEVTLIGRSRWEKALYLVLISGLIFASLHKWSTVVRAGLQGGLLVYVIWKKRSEFAKSLIRMPLLPATAYAAFVLAMVVLSVDRYQSLQSWFRLLEMYLLGIAAYHLLDAPGKVRTALLYVLVGFGLVFVMDIQDYLRGLGEQWKWGEIWDQPIDFNHHNTYSAICVMIAPLLVTFIVAGKRLSLRLTCLAILLLDIFLLYILQSRTAQLTLLFSAGLAGFFMSTTRRKLAYLGLVALLGLVVIVNIGRVSPRWKDPSTWTGTGRTETWKNTFTLVKEKPLLGWGYGRKVFGHTYEERYGLLDFQGHLLKIPHSHSGYLDRLFANGIVGLALFLLIPVTAFHRLARAIIARSDDWIVARALLISLAATFFYYIGDVHDGAQWGLMWFVLGVSMRFGKDSPGMSRRVAASRESGQQ